MRGRAVILAASLAAIAGCGGDAVAPAPDADVAALVRAEPALRDEVVVTVAGRVDEPRPIGHALPLAFVGLATVRDDGAPVAPGEPLAELDPAEPAWLLRQDQGKIVEQEAGDRLDRLRAEAKLAELAAKRDELAAKRDVLVAGIAATRIKDQAQLAIARAQRDAADRRAASARARVAALRALAAAGHGAAQELVRAEQDAAVAEAQAEAPRVALDLVERSTAAVARERLKLQLATLDADLGDTASGTGLYAAMRTLTALRDKQAAIAAEGLASLRRENALRRAVIDHPTITATGGGTVRLRDAGVRAGAKLRAAFFAYVLPDGARAVQFALPERLRDRVRPWSEADPGQGLASVVVDGAGGPVPARIESIAAAPEVDRLGERGYACVVRLDRAVDALHPGMHARVDLRIALDHAAAVVPTWCLADLSAPRALLADGAERALTGFALGGRFIALGGLAPGDSLKPATPAPKRDATRVTGVVQAARFQPVRLSSGEWELLETVADGTRVAAGDVIARLQKTAEWRDPQLAGFQLEFGHAQASANLAIARIQADDDLAQATVAWRKAAVAVDSARLEEIVARINIDDEATAKAEAARVAAEVRLARASAQAVELDDAALAGGLALHERDDRRVELARARLAARSARLDACAARRAIDWLAIADAEATTRSAEIAAAAARSDASVGRVAFAAALARAQNRYRDEVARLKRWREQVADAVVRAPCAGRVYQRPQWGAKPLRVGDDLRSLEPWVIPVGGGREFTIEVPARFYGRFHVGERIDFIAPALGAAPRAGRVARLAGAFVDGEAARERIAERGTVGMPEKVFHLTIAFDLAEADADRLPPGTTAYVDL